ncbi:MAG: hypothetical protein DMG53_06725 [Acidobacteria bacterium]|nr:MAG: hypothetical protein DMG53_06725 [Acidobacteriota bacterium]
METKQERPLRLALVGMSGAGKTFWAKKLAAIQYPTVSCDDWIEQKLAPRLAAGGYRGTSGVAAWMGWPDSTTYTRHESEYLAEEIHTLDEILTELEKQPEKSLKSHLRRWRDVTRRCLPRGVKAMKRWRIARSKLPPCGMDRWTPRRS